MRVGAAILFLLLGACGGDDLREARALLDLPDDAVQICDDPAILGRRIDRIDGPGACGIDRPVRVYAVAGVRLSPSARVNCGTARALKSWVREDAQPIARDIGTRIEKLRVAASYACRTRNSRRGARLSEHASGNAIDISEFTFANGDVATVSDDWASGQYSRPLQRMHAQACGPFGTVLGPRSDRFHQNHFHFDIARHRSGPYCR